MGHMPGELPRPVGVDMVVDGLLADMCPLFSEHSGYLGGRPILLYHAVDAPPQLLRLAVVALETVLAAVTLGLSLFPYIAAVRFRVALYLAAYR